MISQRLQSQLWLHLVVVIFGFTAILGKLISISSVPLVWYRLLIAVAGLAVYAAVAGVSLRISRADLIKIGATGLLTALHWVLFFESIKRSNVSIALICLSTGALFTALIEPLAFKRPFRAYELVFGALTIVGLYFIFSFERRYAAGIVFGLLSSLISAVFVVINGRLVRRHDSTLISFYELLAGLVGISLFLPFFSEARAELWQVSASDILCLLVLGWLCTAFAFAMNVAVMKTLSPFTVMLTVNLEPVYGIALALAIFGESERMTPQFYVGEAFILSTILADALVKRKQSSSDLEEG